MQCHDKTQELLSNGDKMEIDKFIEKWSYVAGQRAGYMSGSKYNAILRVLKETSIREKVLEKTGPRLLQLDLSGNQKPLKANRLDDEDLEILLEALNELDSSTSVVLGLRYNSISNAGMDCLCKYMEVCYIHNHSLIIIHVRVGLQ